LYVFSEIRASFGAVHAGKAAIQEFCLNCCAASWNGVLLGRVAEASRMTGAWGRLGFHARFPLIGARELPFGKSR